MRIRYISFLLLSMLLLSGCVKNRFTIEAELDAKVSGTFSLTYYASDKKKGWMVETMLTLTEGRGKVECITRNPTAVWVNASPRGVPVVIWAERGDNITIKGTKRDPIEWEISGNKVNEEWSQWRKNNLKALRKGEAKDVNAAVAEYVNKNPDSELAILLMLTTYMRKDDEAGFEKLWNKIPLDAKSPEILSAVGRADLMTSAPIDPPVKVGPYKLHCKGDTVLTTVNPSQSDLSLIYFWEGDEQSRPQDLDSLKELYKRDFGGRKLDITDIALTQDSMTWQTKMRADSLTSVEWRRGWAPGGRLNKGIAVFEVAATPWFVVLDSKGTQLYRGTDRTQALKTLRERMSRIKIKTDTAKSTQSKEIKEVKR